MITMEQYAGKWGDEFNASVVYPVNAQILLNQVNAILDHLESEGCEVKTNPITGCWVGGESFGGFRPQSCPIGAPASAHKTGEAIDIYDPLNELDNFITKNPELLVRFGLYREHPDATPHWLHLTTRAPHSGNRSFYP